MVGLAAPARAADPAPAVVKVGAGSYTTQIPAGAKEPPATIYKTEKVRGAVPTNDWWTSLAWVKYSEPQFAHPLAVQAAPAGLRVYYPGASIVVNPTLGMIAGMPGGGQDFVIGHSAVAEFPDARLDGWSDWFVTASFAAADGAMKVTYGHGSPFVYVLYEKGEPRLTFAAPPTVWAGNAQAPALGVSVGPRHYGLFAPAGATWSGLGEKVLAPRSGKPYFSVAVLPDNSPETLALFARYAYTHVTDTRVEWSYDEKSSTVTTRYAFTTRPCQGAETATLFALYPHQWSRSDAPLLKHTYNSVRGTMKLACGTSFTTRMTFPGVLPSLPDAGTYDKPRLRQYVEEEAGKPSPGSKDTYWEGKHLGKLATLLPIAEQSGAADSAARLLAELKARLQNWLAAADAAGQPKRAGVFYYNRNWGTLIGYPASYGSDTELNDHQFHYGYFVKAAAEVARHDRAWAADAQWGGMVRLLIRDFACPDRNDPMLPFLRNFDPYAGHSWASGSAKFADGNNQESSSEAMNAWTAVILWGQAVGDRRTRDMGIYLYTTEMEAINDYWFDVLGQYRPKAYTPSVVTMIWGGKGVNETWFTRKPELVHGINWLPIHGGSLYLGLYPEYVRRNYDALVSELGGKPFTGWVDLVLMYRALDDPQDAIRQFDARGGQVPMEGGNTRANLYHWIHNLAALGRVDRTVTADYPLYAVFAQGENRSHVVYNMGPARRTVTFSDGVAVTVEPGTFSAKRVTRPRGE